MQPPIVTKRGNMMRRLWLMLKADRDHRDLQLCGLTFELTGHATVGGLRLVAHNERAVATRRKTNAVACPVERGVRPHSQPAKRCGGA